jgi:membrane protease YdiL (CAAX protease family)
MLYIIFLLLLQLQRMGRYCIIKYTQLFYEEETPMESSKTTFLKRYSLILFLVLTFLISWFPWYAGSGGLWVFGPSIAGVIVTMVAYGKEGMRDLLQRALRWRVGLRWWIIALFLPGLLTLFGVLLNVALGGKMPPFTFFRQEWCLAPVFFLMTIVGGPLGEEFGWRGFALPKVQNKWGPLVGTLALGLVWGLWHLPEFLRPGSLHYEIGLGFLPVYVAGSLSLSILMTWVYNKTRGSLLVGGIIYHNADNFWGTVLMTGVTMTDALRGEGSSTLDLQLWIVGVAVAVVAAIGLVIATKGRLGLDDVVPSRLKRKT